MDKLNRNFDIAIIGAGIVGMSVAYELTQRDSSLKIAIFEKESDIGIHASGRNSGVLHCGIYYREDSLKAKVCAKGSEMMKSFAKANAVPLFNGGKVIVPSSEQQVSTLDSLMNNAQKNGVEAYWINEKELLKLEPYARPVEKAIYCPQTSVIDNKAVLVALKKQLIEKGVQFIHQCCILNIQNRKLITTKGHFYYHFLFNCAGAYADQIAKMEGLANDYTLLPFKGIYYKLSHEIAPQIRSNIYPVPDISTPFLGVHFTRSISGDVYVGPTAIPVFGRENYRRLQGIKLHETSELLFQLMKLLWSNQNNFRMLAQSEIMKYSKQVFFKNAKKLVPSLKIDDLVPSTKAGIRPQLMNKKNMSLEMDYIFEKTDSSIHILNAISPAFTSSFAFAEMILNESKVYEKNESLLV